MAMVCRGVLHPEAVPVPPVSCSSPGSPGRKMNVSLTSPVRSSWGTEGFPEFSQSPCLSDHHLPFAEDKANIRKKYFSVSPLSEGMCAEVSGTGELEGKVANSSARLGPSCALEGKDAAISSLVHHLQRPS